MTEFDCCSLLDFRKVGKPSFPLNGFSTLVCCTLFLELGLDFLPIGWAGKISVIGRSAAVPDDELCEFWLVWSTGVLFFGVADGVLLFPSVPEFSFAFKLSRGETTALVNSAGMEPKIRDSVGSLVASIPLLLSELSRSPIQFSFWFSLFLEFLSISFWKHFSSLFYLLPVCPLRSTLPLRCCFSQTSRSCDRWPSFFLRRISERLRVFFRLKQFFNYFWWNFSKVLLMDSSIAYCDRMIWFFGH